MINNGTLLGKLYNSGIHRVQSFGLGAVLFKIDANDKCSAIFKLGTVTKFADDTAVCHEKD